MRILLATLDGHNASIFEAPFVHHAKPSLSYLIGLGEIGRGSAQLRHGECLRSRGLSLGFNTGTEGLETSQTALQGSSLHGANRKCSTVLVVKTLPTVLPIRILVVFIFGSGSQTCASQETGIHATHC